MSDFRQYEEAVAIHNVNLKGNSTPVNCWDFHNNFLDEVKNYILDLNKLNAIALQNKWVQSNLDLKNSLKEEVVIVTDVKLKIVFASHNIVAMNGYTAAEVLGKNPKMFQGKQTNSVTSNEIRNAVLKLQPFEKTLINYKKNGDI